LALQAGIDCVIVSHRLELARAVVDAIVSAVEGGRLELARLEEAAARVARLRRQAPMPEEEDDAQIGLDIARRAVTSLRGRARLESDAPVTVVSFEDGLTDGVGDVERASLNAALRRRGVRSEQMRVSRTPAEEDLGLLLSVLDGLGSREIVVVTRRADLFPAQCAAVARLLEDRPHALVVSAREPYDAAVLGGAESLLCIYGDQQVCFDGLADVLTGRVPVGG
jgi:beta-N-acetylhexosaminidase